MSSHITVVIRFEEGQEQPAFHADMEVLGGKVVGVMFDDALSQLEEAEDRLTCEIDIPIGFGIRKDCKEDRLR